MSGGTDACGLVRAAVVALALTACAGADRSSSPATVRRPNVLLIVADDLGYSDLSAYGSEIATPRLDALANAGILFTQFYASPACSPSRAMLLSGVDHHPAGLGNVQEWLAPDQVGRPGYEGRLSDRVLTLAEALQQAGYRTYMTGKWHLGVPEESAGPAQRGFARSFALLDSGAGHFTNRLPLVGPGVARYSEDGVDVPGLPADFYSTRFFAETLVRYLEADREDDRPFLAYLAFTAPHFPLQAPQESIARFAGKYTAGYEAIHAQRLHRMQDLGLIGPDVRAFPRLPWEKAWDALTPRQQRVEARKMEVYAAMIHDLDEYVGTVIDYLRSRGDYDDTIIVFLSDNGPEGHDLSQGMNALATWAGTCCDNRLENLGRPDSYAVPGPDWARVSAAPFRMFKGFTSEGGIRVPAFIHYPAGIPGGRRYTAPATAMDIMPTLLELAGVADPGRNLQGREILPMQGRSLLPDLRADSGADRPPERAIGWELLGRRALRRGPWKIVWETSHAEWWQSERLGIRRNAWQLYNLDDDPAEISDLAPSQPARTAQMIGLWEAYAATNAVVVPRTMRGY